MMYFQICKKFVIKRTMINCFLCTLRERQEVTRLICSKGLDLILGKKLGKQLSTERV